MGTEKKTMKALKMPISEKKVPKTYLDAIFTGYRRSKTNQNTNQALVKIMGVTTAEDAAFYVNNVVKLDNDVCVDISATKKNVKVTRKEGVILGTHGKSGMVRVKFRKNLPG